jgi:hypothetical protein
VNSQVVSLVAWSFMKQVLSRENYVFQASLIVGALCRSFLNSKSTSIPAGSQARETPKKLAIAWLVISYIHEIWNS